MDKNEDSKNFGWFRASRFFISGAMVKCKYMQRRIYFLCNTVQVVVAYNYPSGVLPVGILQDRSE